MRAASGQSASTATMRKPWPRDQRARDARAHRGRTRRCRGWPRRAARRARRRCGRAAAGDRRPSTSANGSAQRARRAVAQASWTVSSAAPAERPGHAAALRGDVLVPAFARRSAARSARPPRSSSLARIVAAVRRHAQQASASPSSPTGITSRPPIASCSRSAAGTLGPPAATTIAS